MDLATLEQRAEPANHLRRALILVDDVVENLVELREVTDSTLQELARRLGVVVTLAGLVGYHRVEVEQTRPWRTVIEELLTRWESTLLPSPDLGGTPAAPR